MTALTPKSGFGPRGLLDVQSPAPRGLLDISRSNANIRDSAVISADDFSRQPLPSLNLPASPTQGLLPRPMPRPDTKPSPQPVPKPAPAQPAQSKDKPTFAGALSIGAEHTGRFVEGNHAFAMGIGQPVAKKFGDSLDMVPKLHRGFGMAGIPFTIAEEGLGAIHDMQNKVPPEVAIPGAVIHGLGTFGTGAVVGGLLGVPFGPVGVAAGGLLGSWAADKLLPSRRELGKHYNKYAPLAPVDPILVIN